MISFRVPILGRVIIRTARGSAKYARDHPSRTVLVDYQEAMHNVWTVVGLSGTEVYLSKAILPGDDPYAVLENALDEAHKRLQQQLGPNVITKYQYTNRAWAKVIELEGDKCRDVLRKN